MNPQQQDQHIRRLSSAGIDTAGAQQTGQFELRSNTDRYLRDGRFDQDGVPEVFKQLTTSGAGSGFPLSRIACRMDWAAHSRTHLENLIEFESRVNHVWRRHGDAIICTCRLQQFSGDTVIDIIRTHPLVIIGGVSHQNSFFIPPEQFLPDFRERQAKQTVRNQTV